ncbi:hypothetical protein FB45DRAFT_732532 [Roridomyces roridus]|uniref:RRM domain-containing protein n=1 Tax=Roridomyces roridus TaxID=1738132 RepID=A0AAD7CL65_9AGAR|nr:hypothetical protein FB45DRAFT_732532 [Roridomyces roridus]
MDAEYARQVCALMRWEARVWVPAAPDDSGPNASGGSQAANNAGYCVLTFGGGAAANAALNQVNNPSTGTPMTMPNSARPFVLAWAPANLAAAAAATASAPSPATASSIQPTTTSTFQSNGNGHASYAKEYSIFVGDLAPETSNSDLVAVFRNPVLGLRNDRAPKFIRPFASCKSAKIMLDPVTGVSRGYGFVRFTDEADQQRALIEMHGLYCLSRPRHQAPASVSVSAAIAGPASGAGVGYFSGPTDPVYTPPGPLTEEWKHHAHARAILGNLIGPNGEQLTSTDPYNTTVFVGGLSPLVGEETLRTFFVPFGEIHYVKVPVGKHCGFVQFVRKADAERAIEKMQGFPVGGSRIRLSWGRSQCKSFCRFRAWSLLTSCSDKAAQAAAQAAQAAALQAVAVPPPQPQPEPPAAPAITPAMLTGMTQEQAILLLQKFGLSGPPSPSPVHSNGSAHAAEGFQQSQQQPQQTQPQQPTVPPTFTEDNLKVRREEGPFLHNEQRNAYEVSPTSAGSTFSPFSPDPNQRGQQLQQTQNQSQQQSSLHAPPDMLGTRRDSYSALPHPSKAYAPGFFPIPNGGSGSAKIPAATPTTRVYGSGFAGSPPSLQINRYQAHHPQTQPISRPNSGPARGSEREREEFDSMHDLNGTLASLDLDRERELSVGDRPWSLRSPLPKSVSEESTSSGGSVQFQMTMGRTPSP